MVKTGGQEIPIPAICASILTSDLSSMKSRLNKSIQKGADLVELRLDKLNDEDGWKELLPTEIPSIVTNRSKKEGGHFEGGEDERIEPLLEAIEAGASCIDIELSTSESLRNKVLKNAKMRGTSIIISFHDFEKVPKTRDLMEKGKKIEKIGSDFAKIIGFANNPEEAIKILKFQILSSSELDIPIISFAMGEEGKFTRLTSPLLSSPITYASIDEKTAPGQLKIAEVRETLEKYRN